LATFSIKPLVLWADAIISSSALKLLSIELGTISAQNAINVIWPPGSAQTRWGRLSSPPPPDSLAVAEEEVEMKRGAVVKVQN